MLTNSVILNASRNVVKLGGNEMRKREMRRLIREKVIIAK